MNPVITIPESDLVAVLGEHGEHWAQNTWGQDGFMCLHGAIRRCQPQPGDAFIIEQVASRQGWGPVWNDAKSTTWPMVRERLAHIEVSDVDLAVTIGPQWEQVVALVRRAAVLTADEAERLAAAWTAALEVGGYAARDAARPAVWYTARRNARYAAWTTALEVGGYAARDAAEALVVRDLIGRRGFTQAHYDLLTGPWAKVIGPVHPDDRTAAVAH
jgi:hypothetical protein